jgi:hypothetical protein
MPTRKITLNAFADVPDPLPPECRHPDHRPAVDDLDLGYYEHACIKCGARLVFTIGPRDRRG